MQLKCCAECVVCCVCFHCVVVVCGCGFVGVWVSCILKTSLILVLSPNCVTDLQGSFLRGFVLKGNGCDLPVRFTAYSGYFIVKLLMSLSGGGGGGGGGGMNECWMNVG